MRMFELIDKLSAIENARIHMNEMSRQWNKSISDHDKHIFRVRYQAAEVALDRLLNEAIV